jgi:hypothetical protein
MPLTRVNLCLCYDRVALLNFISAAIVSAPSPLSGNNIAIVQTELGYLSEERRAIVCQSSRPDSALRSKA